MMRVRSLGHLPSGFENAGQAFLVVSLFPR